MVFRFTIHGEQVTISIRSGALSVMFDAREVLTYDHGGRLWVLTRNGHTYKRGLNGHLLEKYHTSNGLIRRRVSDAEAAELIDAAAARMASLRDGLAKEVAARAASNGAPVQASDFRKPESREAAARAASDGALDQLLHMVERASHFNAAAHVADRNLFEQVYDPVGILPPDQYMAVVVQATEGCSFNTCTFCDFYRGRRFRIKSPDEFRVHARAVRAFFGDSILLRRSIFLGEANALATPTRRLETFMQIAHEEIGDLPIHSFLDGLTGSKKTASEYARLGMLGLTRVSIGMESGHDPLLAFVQKPSSAADIVATVTALKHAGIAVSVIVLVGLGGDRFAAGHVADTVAVLNRLPLEAGDIIYFSTLSERANAPYAAQIRAAGIRPLNEAELCAQRQAIVERLNFGSPGPRIATYDIHEFIY